MNKKKFLLVFFFLIDKIKDLQYEPGFGIYDIQERNNERNKNHIPN